MTIKRFFEICYATVIIALSITVINLYLSGWDISWDQILLDTGINLMFAFSLTLVNNAFFYVMELHYSWEQNASKRLIFGSLGSVAVTMLTIFILLFITRVVIHNEPVHVFFEKQNLEWYVFSLIITIIITVFFHAVYFYKRLQAIKVTEQTVIARSATAQFDALKNQLDPHFLFNSLNVLVSLIEENQKAAVKFTTSLSKVYRYVLEQRNKEVVTIDEELKFAQTYVHLLQMRFEDSLVIDIPEKASNPTDMVVPLSLQLLLENAVKHNVVSDSRPLHLKIYEQDGQLVIENNLQIKGVVKKGSGVGLKNISSRYGLLTHREMSIVKTDDVYRVHIPILTTQEIQEPIKTKSMETYNLEETQVAQAREKVRELKDFYDSALKTFGILSFLAVINYFSSDFPWVIFPAIGMSIGLLFQYLKTTDRRLFLSKKWEQRKIDELMNDKNF
jgi:sensor histidine kinase YesM